MQLNAIRDVLPILTNPDMARTLLTHSRVSCLTFEGGTFYYLDRTQHKAGSQGNAHHLGGGGGVHIALTGITKVIKELYWKDDSWWPKSKSAEAQALKKTAARRKALSSANPLNNKKWKTGQELARSNVRGSIVHRQLVEWIQLDKPNFLIRNPDGQHILTEMAFAALKAKNLVPLAAEYRVACEEETVRLGTAIDLVCVNINTSRVHFIEVKSSYSRGLFYFDDQQVPFQGLLGRLQKQYPKKLPHSNCTKARIQLAVGVLMAVEGLGLWNNFDDFDASVLLLCEGVKADWIPITPEFYERFGGPIYKDLKMKIDGWRQEKKKDRPKGAVKQQQQQ
jgi:hypothetical protein